MPADILIYAIIAAGLVFWLRSILGTRHGDERQRPNPFASQSGAPQGTTGPVSGNVKPLGGAGASSIEEMSQALAHHMSISSPAAETGLMAISRADRSFDLARFMQAAQEAFIMVVEAFAEKDRATLQDLISPNLMTAFDGVIAAREKAGEAASVEIHAVRKAEILDARLQKKMAFITVRFVSDETNLLYDRDKKLLHGNPERVTETIDIWTFGRNLRSRDPAWLVYETRDEDAATEDHKTVPDAQGSSEQDDK